MRGRTASFPLMNLKRHIRWSHGVCYSRGYCAVGDQYRRHQFIEGCDRRDRRHRDGRDAIEEASRLGESGFSFGFLEPKIAKFITECKLIKKSCDRRGRTARFPGASLSFPGGAPRGRARSAQYYVGIPILLSDGKRLIFARRAVKRQGLGGETVDS